MPTPPSPQNYQIGGMRVILGGLDLGNIVTAEINAQDITVVQHFTARSGARVLDDQRVVQKRLFFKFSLDEHQADLYRKYFMGGGTGNNVRLLTNPLAETNIVVEYRNESGIIWTYSHTRAQARPSAAMNFSDFNTYVRFDLDVEILEDLQNAPDSGAATMGLLTFA
jgi:hypothetical protein